MFRTVLKSFIKKPYSPQYQRGQQIQKQYQAQNYRYWLVSAVAWNSIEFQRSSTFIFANILIHFQILCLQYLKSKNCSPMQTSLRQPKFKKAQSNLQIIGELDEIVALKKKKSLNSDDDLTQRLFKTKSFNSMSSSSIYEVPNHILLKDALKNPFLMKKLQLSVKEELKRQQQKGLKIQVKGVKDHEKPVSIRQLTRNSDRDQGKKINELSEYLNIKA